MKKKGTDRDSLLYKDVPSIYLPRESIRAQKIKEKVVGFLVTCVFLLIVIFMIGTFASTSLDAPKPRDQTQRAVSESDANIMSITLCEMRTRDTLKAPRSAKFPWVKKASFDGSLAILKSYVDAQNSFGAMIRTNYICTVRYKGGDPDNSESWNIEEFMIIE